MLIIPAAIRRFELIAVGNFFWSQVLRASTALLQHMKAQQQQKQEASTKKTLIGDNDDASDAEDAPTSIEPVWLVLTTKKHVVDKNRLKPGKISIPHSLNTLPSLSICLITADPQRSVKDIVADPSFPTSLSSRINKIIGFSKLKARYHSFESRRQLLAEHDVFLADDRIIMRLVTTLGKIFYQSSKRPIPVRIEQIEKVDGKRVKKDAKKKVPKDERVATFASPLVVAKEIERTLNSAAVQLAPSTTTAVRVGHTNLTPQQLMENVEAVVKGLTDKFITKGWRNVKAIHVKGPNTMAMPIWLASELWLDETDVVEDAADEKPKAIEGAENEKKRKSIGEEAPPMEESKKTKKSKTVKDDEESALIAARKEKLQKQKAKALEEGDVSTVKAIPNGAGESSGKKKKRKSTS
jgi:ribosome biogenesis protein UTP30